ncbi:MAG: hypothetical protein K6B42_02905 [Clostridia bacterium]|nr:hypothetical protein [Clostridia bacterium]
MIRKKLVIGILLLFAMFMIVGCGDSPTDADAKDHEFTGFQTEKVETGLLDSISAMVSDNDLDFSSLVYYANDDNSIEIGDFAMVEGVIPGDSYSTDDVDVWTDSEGLVSIEDMEIEEESGDSVLTFDIAGKRTGNETIYVQLKGSDYYHYFALDIIEPVDTSSEEAYSENSDSDRTYDADSFEAYEAPESAESTSRSALDTSSSDDRIVYRTETGEKYHSYGCSYLSRSCIEITLSEALARGLEPCSRCHPGY